MEPKPAFGLAEAIRLSDVFSIASDLVTVAGCTKLRLGCATSREERGDRVLALALSDFGQSSTSYAKEQPYVSANARQSNLHLMDRINTINRITFS